MLEYSEEGWRQKIIWSNSRDHSKWPEIGDYVVALECWKHAHIQDVRRNCNWRVQWLAQQPATNRSRSNEADEAILKWLRSEVWLHGGIESEVTTAIVWGDSGYCLHRGTPFLTANATVQREAFDDC